MAKLVILITPLLDEAHTVAEAWHKAGAPGVTFIESYGIRRVQEASESVEVLPGMMSMLELLRSRDQTSLILMSVVKDESIVQPLVDAARAEVGDLDAPNNGILFVIDVERALGVRPYGS